MMNQSDRETIASDMGLALHGQEGIVRVRVDIGRQLLIEIKLFKNRGSRRCFRKCRCHDVRCLSRRKQSQPRAWVQRNRQKLYSDAKRCGAPGSDTARSGA